MIAIALHMMDPGLSGGALVDSSGLDWLPVLRWGSSAGALTSRGGDGFNAVISWIQTIPANVSGIFLSLGNGLWGAAANLQKWASGTDLVAALGPRMNMIAGSLYTGLAADWLILALPLMVAVVGGAWAATRGRGVGEFVKRVVCAFAGLALFVTMGATSAASPDGKGTGTPWWLVDTASSLVNTVGSGVADSLLTSDAAQMSGSFYANGDTDDLLSCRRYLNQLDENYQTAADAGSGGTAILTSLNRLWEETGLRIWVREQFGDSGDNGDQVFCRVLESRAGATASTQYQVTDDASGGMLTVKAEDVGSEHPENAIAWWPNLMTVNEIDESSDDGGEEPEVMLDRTIMLFNTCGMSRSGDFRERDGFEFVDNFKGSNRGVTEEGDPANSRDEVASVPHQCKAALTGRLGGANLSVKADGSSFGLSDGARALVNKFNIPTDSNWQNMAAKYADDTGSAERAIASVKAQHGYTSMGDVGSSMLFVLSGLVNLIVWGALSLLQLLCQLMALFVASFGVLLGGLLLAFSPEKGQRAVMNAFGRTFGMMVALTGVGIIAAIGCVYVNAMMAAMNFLSGSGSTQASMFTLCLASMLLPLSYVWLIRWLCVSVWHVGNPFSLNGLRAIAGGAPVMGAMHRVAGAIGGGIGGFMTGGLTGAGMGMLSGLGGRGGLLRGMENGMWFGGTRRHATSGGGGRHAAGSGRAESAADSAAASQSDAGPQVEPSAADADAGEGVETERMAEPRIKLNGSDAPTDTDGTADAKPAPEGAPVSSEADGSVMDMPEPPSPPDELSDLLGGEATPFERLQLSEYEKIAERQIRREKQREVLNEGWGSLKLAGQQVDRIMNTPHIADEIHARALGMTLEQQTPTKLGLAANRAANAARTTFRNRTAIPSARLRQDMRNMSERADKAGRSGNAKIMKIAQRYPKMGGAMMSATHTIPAAARTVATAGRAVAGAAGRFAVAHPYATSAMLTAATGFAPAMAAGVIGHSMLNEHGFLRRIGSNVADMGVKAAKNGERLTSRSAPAIMRTAAAVSAREHLTVTRFRVDGSEERKPNMDVPEELHVSETTRRTFPAVKPAPSA